MKPLQKLNFAKFADAAAYALGSEAFEDCVHLSRAEPEVVVPWSRDGSWTDSVNTNLTLLKVHGSGARE